MAIKNVGIKIFGAVLAIGLITLISQQDKLNCMIATYNLNFNRVELTHSDSAMYMKQFNVSNSQYKLSLIELGGQGCKPCKQMEAELAIVKNEFGDDLNLKLINVTKGEERKAASYFGIRFIPVQIILAADGRELYRHSGFISSEELKTEIQKLIK